MGNRVVGWWVVKVTIAPLIGKKIEDIGGGAAGVAGAAGAAGVQVTTEVPLNLVFQR